MESIVLFLLKWFIFCVPSFIALKFLPRLHHQKSKKASNLMIVYQVSCFLLLLILAWKKTGFDLSHPLFPLLLVSFGLSFGLLSCFRSSKPKKINIKNLSRKEQFLILLGGKKYIFLMIATIVFAFWISYPEMKTFRFFSILFSIMQVIYLGVFPNFHESWACAKRSGSFFLYGSKDKEKFWIKKSKILSVELEDSQGEKFWIPKLCFPTFILSPTKK